MRKNIIDDGISVFFCLQGNGKSYVCSHKAAYELMNPNSKRIVLSNYPISVKIPLTFKQKLINKILSYYKKDELDITLFNKTIHLKKYIPIIKRSYQWKDNYTAEAVTNALIIIDESHTKYTGAYAYELTKEDRMFFSTLRHNNNALFLMSQSYEDIHPFIRKRFAYLNEVSKVKHFWKKTPSCFYINTYTSIKLYLHKDEHKLHKKAKKTIFRKEKIPFTQMIGECYNTHQYKNTGIPPKYKLWGDSIDIDIENSDMQVLNNNIKKDTIAALVRLNKWKKKDAVLEINKIITEYDISEINTVEKMLRIALSRQLTEKEEELEI